METLINEKYQATDSETILSNYKEALDKAAEKIREKNWRCSLNMKDLENVGLELEDLSGNARKKFRNKIVKVLKKPSLRNINQLFWFISKIVLKTKINYNVKISVKEEAIQKAKKECKEARDLAEDYLQTYKKEKGNFYKIKA